VSPGATGPTDDSDLTIKKNGVDILGGNGANIVDNAVDGYCVPKGTNSDSPFPVLVDHPLTVGIANNAVNSAVVTITMVFER
jgi:hypothetical protein